jgi:translation elongation factor EF-G
MWTVDREFDQPIRHKKQFCSGGSFLANLTLRFTPDLNVPGVLFTSDLIDPDAAEFVPSVEDGVRRFVGRRAEEGVSIGHLRVTLTKMPIHPVDASPSRFKEAAEMAMAEAFKSHGVET